MNWKRQHTGTLNQNKSISSAVICFDCDQTLTDALFALIVYDIRASAHCYSESKRKQNRLCFDLGPRVNLKWRAFNWRRQAQEQHIFISRFQSTKMRELTRSFLHLFHRISNVSKINRNFSTFWHENGSPMRLKTFISQNWHWWTCQKSMKSVKVLFWEGEKCIVIYHQK